MRAFRLTLLFASLTILAILSARDASAQEAITLSPISSMPEMEIGDVYTFTATVDTTNGNASGWYNLTVGPISVSYVEFDPFTGIASVNIPVDQSMLDACVNGAGSLQYTQQAIVYGPVYGSPYSSTRLPCSVLISPQIIAPLMTPVESCNNNTLSVPAQPTGVNASYSSTGWVNGWQTISFSPIAGYVFTTGTVTNFDYRDADPCIVYPEEPVQTAVCGTNNDEVVIPSQPPGITVGGDGGWTTEGRWNITFGTLDGYVIPDGVQIEYPLVDNGPCIVNPVPPVHTLVCGINNDNVVIPTQLTGVTVGGDGTWTSEGTWEITFGTLDGYEIPADVQVMYLLTDPGLCVTDDPVPPSHNKVCGFNNDEYATYQQPDNVIQSRSYDEANGVMTVEFSAAENYMLPADAITSYTFYEQGLCETEMPVAPTAIVVCGENNDQISIPDQPANVLVGGDTAWEDNVWTVTFAAAENYELPATAENVYRFEDDGPCETDTPLLPVVDAVCGPNNDVVIIPDQPANITVVTDLDWSDGEWKVAYSADEHYLLPADFQPSITLIDEETPCPTDAPAPPVQTLVCGPNNDLLTFQDQPEGVTLDSDSDWQEGVRTVEFAIAPDFVTEGDTVFTFTDEDTPCPTDAPAPPVQTMVCGPNNDELEFPDQPEGVTLDSDTDWNDNERTITFVIAPEFTTQGETVFTFIDQNEPCEVDPVGVRLMITLATSDGGSLTGTSFQLLSPVASQTGAGVIAEGVVGEGNLIELDSILPGEYRLVMAPSGYERVDFEISVVDGTAVQEVTIQVAAVQIAETPTPEPTASPTQTPTTPTPVPTEAPVTATPTIAPTEAVPTATTPVSGLPETGTGPESASFIGMISVALIAILSVGAIRLNRK